MKTRLLTAYLGRPGTTALAHSGMESRDGLKRMDPMNMTGKALAEQGATCKTCNSRYRT